MHGGSLIRRSKILKAYASGYGSHGCVNLPSDKAAELYDLMQLADVVVVHR